MDEILNLIVSVSEVFPTYFWTMKTGSSQRQFQPARVSFCIYKLNSTDSSPIYGASGFRVFMLLFSFSICSDHCLNETVLMMGHKICFSGKI